ncbi:MAG: ABC-F family ATP-binding cassette domain-containing protein, partial [Mycoplasmatales bacterium]
GLDTADTGRVLNSNVKIGYLSQNPDLDDELTVIEQCVKGINKNHIKTFDYEAKAILSKLQITDFEQKIKNLSGGQKRRVALACVLLNPSDLLILDEPTNHLDNDMILWLETFLKKYNKAILMITHDRYFLDRVTNKIIEVDDKTIYSYDANYSLFLELKAMRDVADEAAYRKLKTTFKKESEWMAQGPKARGTKSIERKAKFEKLQKQMVKQKDSNLELNSVTTRLGTKTIEINNITTSYNDKILINNFSYIPTQIDRIGIVGKNGCGKSTLLNILSQKIQPDSGFIDIGDTVKIGFFSQEVQDMDPNQKVLDYITDIHEHIETIDGTISASQMLEKFLFTPAQQYNKLKYLSGGEKRRLYLLKVLIDQPNILFLDEPTNDLDITTLMILEEYLDNFNGIVITVSHDRYFLDKVVDKIFVFEEDGKIIMHNCGYSDYFETADINLGKEKKANDKKTIVREKNKVSKIKFSYNDKREYETIDDDIFQLEELLAELDELIKKDGSDFVKLKQHLEKRTLLEQQLSHKTERWFYLNDLNDQINNS